MAKDELEKIDINPNFQKNALTKQLVLKQNNLEDLFKQFIIFIDATPNTIRTYRGSLKQWFLYLRENQIVQPTAETVRQYRDYLQENGKKPTTVKNYIIAVKRFFTWTEEEVCIPILPSILKADA